jgi:hypothetical protein
MRYDAVHRQAHCETVEAAKAKVDSDAVHKEWDRRLDEAKIAKFALDWGFRALGRDRPYTVPAGADAIFVRPEAWFAILPDGTMSRHALSAKQKSALQGATSWHDNAAIIGPIRAWGFSFLHRGGKPPSWSEDECYWRAVPAGGILYKTTPVPVSAERSDKLSEIPAEDRLHGWIAATPPAGTVKRKRRWGLLR